MRAAISSHPVRTGVVVGFVLGAIASYIILNIDPLEREVAKADGIPLWSWYQVPFALPGAVMAGLFGAFAGWAISALAARRRARSTRRR